jgi:hypothetical protein
MVIETLSVRFGREIDTSCCTGVGDGDGLDVDGCGRELELEGGRTTGLDEWGEVGCTVWPGAPAADVPGALLVVAAPVVDRLAVADGVCGLGLELAAVVDPSTAAASFAGG